MKIIHIKTHESVIFGKTQQQNFFNKDVPGRGRVEMVLKPEIACVEMKNEIDHVLIPVVNIAFMKLATEASKAKESAKAKEASKPKTNTKPSDIKKPR